MKAIIISMCCLFMVAACGPSPEQQAAMTATAQTATAAAWTPTPTPTITPTATPTPTPTLSPTPTSTPTETLTPTPTHDPQRYYSPDNLFSIRIPEGWETQDFNLKYMGIIGPTTGGGNPNLIFATEENNYALLMYSSAVQNNLKAMYPDMVMITEEHRSTTSGLEYLYLVVEYPVNDVPARQIYYIFQVGSLKFVAIYSRSAQGSSESDPVIDEAIDTIQFEQ